MKKFMRFFILRIICIGYTSLLKRRFVNPFYEECIFYVERIDGFVSKQFKGF